jgi:hypothetical protein
VRQLVVKCELVTALYGSLLVELSRPSDLTLTCFTTIWRTPPSGARPTTTTRSCCQHTMAPPRTNNSPQKEGRLALAVHSLKKDQFSSRRGAARIYIVPETTLRRRQQGILPKRGSKAKNRLLLECEEGELIKWIHSIEQRGFLPYFIDIKRMAQILLARRDTSGSRIVGKN